MATPQPRSPRRRGRNGVVQGEKNAVPMPPPLEEPPQVGRGLEESDDLPTHPVGRSDTRAPDTRAPGDDAPHQATDDSWRQGRQTDEPSIGGLSQSTMIGIAGAVGLAALTLFLILAS